MRYHELRVDFVDDSERRALEGMSQKQLHGSELRSGVYTKSSDIGVRFLSSYKSAMDSPIE